MSGPFPSADCSSIITSSLAVVPKKTPGKWRIIVNLSRPRNASVNDFIRREFTHVAYSSVDDAALIMHTMGRNTELAKIEIRDAYRIIPIHPEDRSFMGIKWREQIYVDCQLPFGLASAPAIFCAVAATLEWILRQRGIRASIHYMDDFLLFGAPKSHECKEALATTLATCQELGVPLAEDKIEGPVTTLSFLGIQLNSDSKCMSLPQDKLATLRNQVSTLASQRTIHDLHTLESLVGHLVHASKVCSLGKAFLNNLFAVLSTMKAGQYRRLNLAARADLGWWQELLASWSGTSIQQFLIRRQPDFHVYSDASGSWGCGAWFGSQWFQVPWPPQSVLTTPALRELFPIILACAVWGSDWTGRLVLCHSDNVAAVMHVNRLHARDPMACHLLRCLAFFQALYECRLRAIHIPAAGNGLADLLSRNNAPMFLHRMSSVCRSPTQVPPDLCKLLCQHTPDWTSLQWRELFSSFWRQASPHPPERHTPQAGSATSPLPQPSPLPLSPSRKRR